MKNFDVIVIGGGPGGYVAAVRASQLGLTTALIEKDNLGGTCLNWGCIPTKSLLQNAEIANLLTKGRTYGFSFDNLTLDYATAHKRSRGIVKRQTKRVEFLMKNNNITLFDGTAKLKNAHEVEISPSGEIVTGKYIIIAAGTQPRALPNVPYDGETIINFRNALSMDKLPSSALIIGAGPIGMEFATLWNRYGVSVTIVEMMDRVLPLEDEDISAEAQKQFTRNGIKIKTGTMVKSISRMAEGADVNISERDKEEIIHAEIVLVSIGFTANTEGLGLESAGIETIKGNIAVNELMQTNVPNIYAIGDVNGEMGLAHVASAQGLIAAETIAGNPTTPLNYKNIPRCTYAHPETASVGLTETQAREEGFDVITAHCPFPANGKAMAMDDNSGFVKIVADKTENTILGVHMVGGHVTELVAGPTSMIQNDFDLEQLAKTVYPHPTISEAIMEAAHKLCGHAIHI